jgi:hypothetical protein
LALTRAESPKKRLENRMTPVNNAKNLAEKRLGVDDSSMAKTKLP